MSVYVDDMFAAYRGMRMCHMLADSTAELLDMARKIDVREKWIQNAGTYREHFDICASKRLLAVKFGAVEVTQRQIGEMLIKRRNFERGKRGEA